MRAGVRKGDQRCDESRTDSFTSPRSFDADEHSVLGKLREVTELLAKAVGRPAVWKGTRTPAGPGCTARRHRSTRIRGSAWRFGARQVRAQVRTERPAMWRRVLCRRRTVAASRHRRVRAAEARAFGVESRD